MILFLLIIHVFTIEKSPNMRKEIENSINRKNKPSKKLNVEADPKNEENAQINNKLTGSRFKKHRIPSSKKLNSTKADRNKNDVKKDDSSFNINENNHIDDLKNDKGDDLNKISKKEQKRKRGHLKNEHFELAGQIKNDEENEKQQNAKYVKNKIHNHEKNKKDRTKVALKSSNPAILKARHLVPTINEHEDDYVNHFIDEEQNEDDNHRKKETPKENKLHEGETFMDMSVNKVVESLNLVKSKNEVEVQKANDKKQGNNYAHAPNDGDEELLKKEETETFGKEQKLNGKEGENNEEITEVETESLNIRVDADKDMLTNEIAPEPAEDDIVTDMKKIEHFWKKKTATSQNGDEKPDFIESENKEENKEENQEENKEVNQEENQEENKEENQEENKEVNQEENKEENQEENKEVNQEENKEEIHKENKEEIPNATKNHFHNNDVDILTGKREDSPREESFITVRFIVVVITVCMIVLGLGYLLWNSFRTVVGKDSPDERVPFKYSMKHQDKQHDDLELHGFSKL